MIKVTIETDNEDLAARIGLALAGQSGAAAEVEPEEVKTVVPSVTPPTGSGDGSAGAGSAEPQATAQGGGEPDEKGVLFDADYCGKAAVPFYASGKREGQWKKRKGVTDEDYDAWYAGELAAVASADERAEKEEDVEDDAFDVAGAVANTNTAEDPAPTNMGELMNWVSKMQAAGRLTPDSMTQACTATGKTFSDIMPTAADPAGAIAAIYGVLAQMAGA